MKPIGVLTILFFLFSLSLSGQYKWNWKDPVDLNHFDLGDNKVLLYNGLAIGIVHFLSKNHLEKKDKFQSFSLEITNEYRKAPISNIYNFKYREGWKYRKFLWLGYEIGTQLVNDDKIIPGIGFSPFFSWNIINKPSFRFSYDNGVGPVYYFESFPEGGTRFNFYTFYGLNFEFFFTSKSVSFGLRNTHISNASLAGDDRNPGFDGFGGYLKLRL